VVAVRPDEKKVLGQYPTVDGTVVERTPLA
jgi:hypothetical protein